MHLRPYLVVFVLLFGCLIVSRATDIDLRHVVSKLARQVQLQQFAHEEQTRTNGGSGLKQQRAFIIGSRPYYTQTHTGFKIAQIHDHANHINTVGMGESVFVLNGVEFRTRHNDYPLNMPHRTSSVYNTVERVPLPEVPPEVLAKSTVPEQVEEMKAWFKAWRDQDYSVRDYRKYFKPVLCYIEGGWYKAENKMEEAFQSDRHFIDALTWEELQNDVQFNTYLGRKNLLENYAYLPRKIINITENGLPVYAQWNYRIMCHPLSQDLPLKYLVQEDDLQARMVHKKTLEEFKYMRGARFRVEGPKERTAYHTLLDDLMEQIPGRDNYQAFLKEDSFGDELSYYTNKTVMNVARYHRSYYNARRDASGNTKGKKGFSDPSLFVAESTQERLAPMYARMCTYKTKRPVCDEATKRVTYAVPLEIIYVTPLHSWNPYKIEHFSEVSTRQFTDGGKRNGGTTKNTAFLGTTTSSYYRTPIEFYGGGDVDQYEPADTAKTFVGMLDENKEVRKVAASGFRIFLPNIPGVGVLRLRYPIMPIHGEASPVWKELNALKDVVLNMKSNAKYLNQPMPIQPSKKGKWTPEQAKKNPRTLTKAIFHMYPATLRADQHIHEVVLNAQQRNTILYGEGNVTVTTSRASGHTHDLVLGNVKGRFTILKADGKPPPTSDGHSKNLRWYRIDYSDGFSKMRN